MHVKIERVQNKNLAGVVFAEFLSMPGTKKGPRLSTYYHALNKKDAVTRRATALV